MHELYPWQRTYLNNIPSRGLLIAAPQSGKTEVAVRLAVQIAKSEPGESIVMITPTPSHTEALKSRLLAQPISTVPTLPGVIELHNGSRIFALPGDISPDDLKKIGPVRLAVIDDAPHCLDILIEPILDLANIHSRGQVIALASSYDGACWFTREWLATGHNWNKTNYAG